MWMIRAEVLVTVVLMLSSGSESKPQTTPTSLSPDDNDAIKILPTGVLAGQQDIANNGKPCVAYDAVPAVCGYHFYPFTWCYTSYDGWWANCTTSKGVLAGQQDIANNGKPCVAYDGVPAVCGYHFYPFTWCYTSYGWWDNCTTSKGMEDSVGLIGDSYVRRFPDIPQGWEKITKWGDPNNAREFVEKDMVNKILNDTARPKKVWIVIILGGNDIPYQTDSKIVQDLYSIAVGFKNHGLTPFICEVNTITHPRTMTAAEYKSRTKNINKGLNDTFIAENWEYDVIVNLPDIEIGEDGVHPTEKGFKDLKQAIVTHMGTYFMQKIISWS